MKSLALALLPACNSIFGVTDVQPQDSLFEIDAPISCPLTGEVPRYTPLPTQLYARRCVDYQRTTAGDLAIGLCVQGTLDLWVEGPAEGTLDQPMFSAFTYQFVALDPAGSTLVVADNSITTTAPLAYHRDSSSWVLDGPLPFSYPAYGLGTLARPGDALHVLIVEDPRMLVHEWVRVGTTWMEQRMSTYGELGLSKLATSTLDLSPDGLRMIAWGTRTGDTSSQMLYFDRADAGAKFNAPQPLAIPDVADAFITADCSRIYYSGLDRVFYSPRSI
jgi:hypothetical protein